LEKEKNLIDHRLRYVELLKYLSAAFLFLVTSIVIKSLLPFTILGDNLEWNDSALIVIISITYFLQGPGYFYESKLLKHLKKLKTEDQEASENDTLNTQLRNAIKDLNCHKKKWYILVSVVILMIASLIHLITDNFEFWYYLKIPFLLFILLILFDFLKNYNRLSRNIKEYEEQ
jgi:hypothetical protein